MTLQQHYLEPSTPTELLELIQSLGEKVERVLQRPGGGAGVCLSESATWKLEFEEHGYQAVVVTERYGTSDIEHHWLAVGAGRHLFDPTAGQFAETMLASQYLVKEHDRERGLGCYVYVPFPTWRASLGSVTGSTFPPPSGTMPTSNIVFQ